ncbi:MAG: hypothetical protein MJ214_05575 [Bacilli bacterium]|nr:hypothetical protein [Bacilli bacterium]
MKDKTKKLITTILETISIVGIAFASAVAGYAARVYHEEKNEANNLVIREKSSAYTNYGSQNRIINRCSFNINWAATNIPVAATLFPGDEVSSDYQYIITSSPSSKYFDIYKEDETLYASHLNTFTSDLEDANATYILKDTPFVSGDFQLPLITSVNLASDEIRQIYPSSGNTSLRSKFLTTYCLSGLNFSLKYINFDSREPSFTNNFDNIYIVYVHSFRVENFKPTTYHDYLGYFAYSSTSKYVVPFASNYIGGFPYGSYSGQSTIGGYHYWNCGALAGFLTASAAQKDDIYYSVNRMNLGAACSLANFETTSTIDAIKLSITGLYSNETKYLTGNTRSYFEYFNKLNLSDVTANSDLSWITLVTLLFTSAFSSFTPLFSMMIIPGVTLGFLFFMPLFISILIIIIKALKK